MALPSLSDLGLGGPGSGSTLTPEEKRRKEIQEILNGVGDYKGSAGSGLDLTSKLSTANAENDTMSGQLAALGQEGEDGTSGPGVLATALGYLSRPGNAVRGFITGATHDIATGMGFGADYTQRAGHEAEDAEDNAFERAWKGLKGEEYGAGDFNWWGRYDENDGFWEKLAKGAVDLGIDIASDPLTYVTMGSGGLAAKAGSEAVEGATKSALLRAGEKTATKEADNLALGAAPGRLALPAGPTPRAAGTPLDGLGTAGAARPMPGVRPMPGPATGKGLVLDDAVEGEIVNNGLVRSTARPMPGRPADDILDAEIIDSPLALPQHARGDFNIVDNAVEGEVIPSWLFPTKQRALGKGDDILDAEVVPDQLALPRRSASDPNWEFGGAPLNNPSTQAAGQAAAHVAGELHPLTGAPVRPALPVAGEAGAGARVAGETGAAGTGAGNATAAANLDEAVKAAVPSPESLAAAGGKGGFGGGSFEARAAAKKADVDELGKLSTEDRIARAAAEGFALKGGRGTLEGLKAGVEKELPHLSAAERDALVKEVFESLPAEHRGAFQVGIFGMKKELTKGGGQSALGQAAAPAAEVLHAVKNKIRASKLLRTPLDKVSGATGKQWGDFLRNAVAKEGSDAAGNGMDYSAYASARDAVRNRRAGAVARDLTYQGTIRAVEDAGEAAGDRKAFGAKLEDYLADDTKLGTDLGADASDVDRLSQGAARTMREEKDDAWAHLNTLREATGQGAADLRNYIDDHVARILTKDAAEEIDKKAVRTGGSRIGEDTSYSPAGRKSQAWFREDGTRMTPREANEAAGKEVFETDPLRIHAAQMNAMNSAISNLETQVRMRNAGLLTKVELHTVDRSNRGSANAFATALGTAADATLKHLKGLDDSDAQMARVLASKDDLSKLVATINGPDPEETAAAIDDLISAYHNIRSTVGTKEWKKLLDDETKKKLSVKDLTSPEPVYDAKQLAAAQALGMKAVGDGIEYADDVVLPKAYEGMFGKDAIVGFLEDGLKSKRKLPAEVEGVYRNVYKPYLTLAKMWMTLGRGPAYVSKNLQGGIYQNVAHGVSAADHKLMAKMLFDGTQSAKQARELLKKAMTGGDPGGDFAADAVRILGENNGMPTTAAIDALTETMMAKHLAGHTVGSTPAIDAWKTLQGHRNELLGAHKGIEGALDNALRDGESNIGAFMDRGSNLNLFPQTHPEDLNLLQRAANKAGNNKWINAHAKMAEGSEEFVRGAAFLSGVRKMGLEDSGVGAAAFARGLHFDYADLSDFERRIMKNVIPFYTWSRMNVPMQLRTLAARPGRFTNMDAARDQTADLLAPDEQTRAEYEAAMPEWLRETNSMVTGMKFGENNLALSWDTPQADLDKWLKVGDNGLPMVDTNQLTNGLNPVLKAGSEAYTNTDSFTGAKFDEKGAPATGWMKALDKIMPGDQAWTDADGQTVMSEKTASVLKNLIPGIGTAEKFPMLGSENTDKRLASNVLAGVGGIPVATLTEDQLAGEIRSRSDRLDPKVDKAAGAAGIDRTWLRAMVAQYGPELTAKFIAEGQGRLGAPNVSQK